jgi:hypothetical protein
LSHFEPLIYGAEDFFHSTPSPFFVNGGTEASSLFEQLYNQISREQLSAKLYNLLSTTTGHIEFVVQLLKNGSPDSWCLPFLYVLSQSIPDGSTKIKLIERNGPLMQPEIEIIDLKTETNIKIVFSDTSRDSIETSLILAIKEITKS